LHTIRIASKSGNRLQRNIDKPGSNFYRQKLRESGKKVCTDSVDNFVIKLVSMPLSHCFVTNLLMLPNLRAAPCNGGEFPTDYVDKPPSNAITTHLTY
jgi:hypothetical protein